LERHVIDVPDTVYFSEIRWETLGFPTTTLIRKQVDELTAFTKHSDK